MYQHTLKSKHVRKNTQQITKTERYLNQKGYVDDSLKFFEYEDYNIKNNYYAYRYDKKDFYKPQLSKLDIKHLTSVLGIKSKDMDSNMALIVADRKDNAYTRTYNIGSYLNKASFYRYKGRSMLMAELEDPFEVRHYYRNYKNLRKGVFMTDETSFDNEMEFKEGYVEETKHKDLRAVKTSQGNIKSTSTFVIDIDFDNTCGYLDKEGSEILAEMLDFELSIIGIPANAYIYTGTGLHLYYYYNKVLWQKYESNKEVINLLFDTYTEVYEIVSKVIKNVVNLTKNTIDAFKHAKDLKVSVDTISVKRPMLRAVGTLHEESQNRCTCVKFNDGMNRWKLQDLIVAAKDYLGKKPTGKQWTDYTKKHTGKSQAFLDNISILNKNRISDVETILTELGVGYRNKAYCSIVVLKLNQGKSLDEIKSELKEFDTQNSVGFFKNNRQVESLVESINNWYERHPKNTLNQVALTNKSYLNFMNLDFDSVDDLNLITLGNLPRSVVRARKAAIKKSRMDQFFDQYTKMWADKKVNISELSRRFEVCRNTIYNWIRILSKRIAEFKFKYLKTLSEKAIEPKNKISSFFNNYLIKTNKESLANDLVNLSAGIIGEKKSRLLVVSS